MISKALPRRRPDLHGVGTADLAIENEEAGLPGPRPGPNRRDRAAVTDSLPGGPHVPDVPGRLRHDAVEG